MSDFSSRPLVAVTTTSVPESGPDSGMTIHLYALYMSVLEQMGVTCVLITPAHSEESVQRLLHVCHGIMVTGGEDVDPCFYGESPVPELGMVNPARDAMELNAVGIAMDRNLPTLAVCRGFQVLNVHFGGTLYQDLETQWEGGVRHRQSEPWFARSHGVKLESDSRLAALVGDDDLVINSFPHQGIREVGDGLRVVGRADDGLVEALELEEEGSWVVGVQWHPERHEAQAPREDPDRRLFRGFRDAAVDYCNRDR